MTYLDLPPDDPSSEGGPTGIPEEYGDFELAEGAVFMTEDMTSMFSSVEDGRILISSSVPQSSVPAEGTINVFIIRGLCADATARRSVQGLQEEVLAHLAAYVVGCAFCQALRPVDRCEVADIEPVDQRQIHL